MAKILSTNLEICYHPEDSYTKSIQFVVLFRTSNTNFNTTPPICKPPSQQHRTPSGPSPETNQVGGFNSSQKYLSNWIISPIRDENKKYLKPPASIFLAKMESYFTNLDFPGNSRGPTISLPKRYQENLPGPGEDPSLCNCRLWKAWICNSVSSAVHAWRSPTHQVGGRNPEVGWISVGNKHHWLFFFGGGEGKGEIILVGYQ